MANTTVTLLHGIVRSGCAVLLLALAAPGVQAQCLQWDLGGHWQIVQSNGTTARFDLQQSGSTLTGTAAYDREKVNGLSLVMGGSLDGTVEEDRIRMVVYWQGGSSGLYKGRIGPSGAISGTTYDQSNPSTDATWRGDRNARCVAEAATPGSKPGLGLGRVTSQAEPGKCEVWNITGDWSVYQANDSWTTFHFSQDQHVLSGSGSHPIKGSRTFAASHGVVSGRITGDRLDFTARWDIGSVGVYSGVINELGRLSGTTFDQADPERLIPWGSDGRAVCAVRHNNPQPPVALGRVQATGTRAPPPSICDAARSARARNSPAAASLEARCRNMGETNVPVSPPSATRAPVEPAELDRLAAIGRGIASQDYELGTVRRSSGDPAYRFGFDVGSALFGDPALGATGSTAIGPGALNIREGLEDAGRQGFDDSMNFHFSRSYTH